MRYLTWMCGAALLLSGCGGGSGEQQVAGMAKTAAAVTSSASTQAVATESFSGARAEYQISVAAGGTTVTRIATGEAKLLAAGVQRLRFADGTLVLDVEGKAGTVYRVYQAAFDRAPDVLGYTFWLNAADAGTSIESIAAEFVKSDEFRQLYGANPSNNDLLARYYQNVLHRQPDQEGFAYWLNALNTGVVSPTTMLAQFADSTENKAQVASTIRNGIWLSSELPPQTIDTMYTITTVGTSAQVAPVHQVDINCSNGQCVRASLYCEAPANVGESSTATMRVVLDAARKKATFTIEGEVLVGSYEPSASGLATVKVDIAYPDELTLDNGIVRYYSSGNIHLDLTYDPGTRRFTGTMSDRVVNRWTVDGHLSECSATSTVTAVPVAK